MENIRALFDELYSDFRRRRDEYIAEDRFRPWFKNGRKSVFPPVIGFGLPRRDDERIPLVTIATNPSTSEFSRHLSRDDDAEVQWMEQTGYFEQRGARGPYRDWFDFSNDLVTEVRAADERLWSHYELVEDGGIAVDGTRNSQRVPHLDLTPIVTDGGMDKVDRDVADKSAGPRLLEDGIRFGLVPLLEHLVRNHGTKLAVVYGYMPEASGDELLKRTLRGLFVRSGREESERGSQGPGIKVAKGDFNMKHPFVMRRDALSGLRVAFCSHGPTHLNSLAGLPRTGIRPTKYSDSMTNAGKVIRSWFSHALRDPVASG